LIRKYETVSHFSSWFLSEVEGKEEYPIAIGGCGFFSKIKIVMNTDGLHSRNFVTNSILSDKKKDLTTNGLRRTRKLGPVSILLNE